MHEGITISVHTHDDLGLATANALAGIQPGARQAEVTINGIGERAGNTSMEEVVMMLKTRHPVFNLELELTPRSLCVSRLVSNYPTANGCSTIECPRPKPWTTTPTGRSS